ncbi:MAG: DNA replication/repair protein RecF [Opitutus sp.]|nr:DNA replication/repair protein RecF [Opitutus sp.]
MRLRQLTLTHFRNVSFAALALEGRQQFLLGANGQGKTNFLEAAGFFGALRSFRTSDAKLLIAHGQPEAALAAEFEHEQLGDTRVTIRLRRDGRELWWDQTKITRLADHVGKFPVVVFSSQDQLLVRGAPSVRRRWMDLTLASVDSGYLLALQAYAKALAARNALLKRGTADPRELAAFEHTMAPAAAELITRRTASFQALAGAVAATYGRVADAGEPAGLVYEPDHAEPTAESLLARWEKQRARDLQFRTTLHGPHRDDFSLTVNERPAREFGSEGQQRALVLALRLAQAAWFHERSGIRPVLLADDVLGELDPVRRRRFWSAIDPEAQVISTGTMLPEADLGAWQIFDVRQGVFTPRAAQA